MAAAQTIPVEVPGHHYNIYLGRDVLADGRLYPADARAGRGIIVSNDTVAPLYLETVKRALGCELPTHILPDGERFKSMEQLDRLLETMLRQHLGRDAIVLALGGGVVGDLAGFAAAIYQRGVRFVQLPTTLLAQVDSSVGGKTAVNHPLGKNMIGAFHQPELVIADIATLDTLPDRELRAGLSEVIKYALLGDAGFVDWLEDQRPALLARDQNALAAAIARCCAHKARIVAADEKERGRRALLNLGHTFGHAIEAHLRYEGGLHGEAVAAGMAMAADLSCRHGWISADQRARITALIDAFGLPVAPPPGLDAERMRALMQGDKKVAAGQLRLVLLKAIGEAVLCADFDPALLDQCLAEACRP